MVSVERILEYGQLSPEGEDTDPGLVDGAGAVAVPLIGHGKTGKTDDGISAVHQALPPDWPTSGELRFRNVSLSYNTTEDRKPVLKDITFDIRPGEKIGIAGRTGAGKSSLLASLFRLYEYQGAIQFDGIHTRSVPLYNLRKNISIIPQDPVIFIGTLRKNLDPFNYYTDAQLWAALEEVQLKPVVSRFTDGLEAPMHEGGSNLSVGERQLMCLARALLKKNPILVLDEATANVDHNTDVLIQETIRRKFKHCTVLTIAHRLHTIIDADRIMVLDGGELKEFDTPNNLLSNKESLFYQLVAETGAQEAEKLRLTAASAAAVESKSE